MSTPSISYISQMLANPQATTDAELDQINALKKAYPYFIPGYFLDAARIQQQHPFSAEVVDIMRATNANWLLFHEFLEQVKKNEGGDTPIQCAKTLTDDIFTPVDTATEIPEELVMQVAEEENTDEDDIMAELRPQNNPDASQAQTTDMHTLSSDFLAEEPGMNSDTDLIHEDDFGHLVPVEQDELLPPFYEETEGPMPEENAEEAQVAAVKEHEVPKQQNKPSEIEATLDEAQEIYRQKLPLEEKQAGKDSQEHQKDNLIKPIYTEDYFRHEGVEISNDLPAAEELNTEETEDETAKSSLMVMMSFSEWLNHYKVKSKAQKEEDNDRKALKTMWQKEKLKAALEEENDEIPEQVFEMAVNSITQDDGLASESIAEIYAKQGKYDKAIDMYRKLSLRNPQKNAYFARKIEEVLKEKQS